MSTSTPHAQAAEPRHGDQRRRHNPQPPPPKLKRRLFWCSLFRECTQIPVSPPHPPEQVELALEKGPATSSSSSNSHSFTQWKFPLLSSSPPPDPPPTFKEIFQVAELEFTTGDRLAALHMLERFLVPNPTTPYMTEVVPAAFIDGVVEMMKQKAGAKSATKVLLALCLGDCNRRAAVERGAAGSVVDALADLEGPTAERALAALDLMCTVEDGAAEVRGHALAVPMLVRVMGEMEGRGREYAISVLGVVFGGGGGGGWEVPPEQVARAVELALERGECSERGRRKGAQLLKALLHHTTPT